MKAIDGWWVCVKDRTLHVAFWIENEIVTVGRMKDGLFVEGWLGDKESFQQQFRKVVAA